MPKAVAATSPRSALDPVTLLSVAARSTGIRSGGALRKWLAGEMRSIIPHDMLLVARRDASNGSLTCEVVTPSQAAPGLEMNASLPQSVEKVFDRWLQTGGVPITMPADGLHEAGEPLGCEAILAHGVADERSNAHYLYMFLGQTELDRPGTREASAVLLPFIDCGFRKLLGRSDAEAAGQGSPSAATAPRAGSSSSGTLSQREVEIMRWVCAGKKNHEIGELLGLSKATVKNHMRRIFQKMEVMNRAQAVETYQRQMASATRRHQAP